MITEVKPIAETRNSETRHNLPLQTRFASLEARAGLDDRTFNVVFTTGAAVRRQDFFSGDSYDEELRVDPNSVRLGRLNTGAPVLDTHEQRSLNNVIGVVVPGSTRLEDGVGKATIRLDSGEENAGIVRKVKEGIIQNVSIGYRVHRYDVMRGDSSVPLYRAVDWEPYEISLVPIGADAGAGVRSTTPLYPCEFNQTYKENAMPELDNKAAENAVRNNEKADNVKPSADNNSTVETKATTETTDLARAEGVKLERQRIAEIQHMARVAKLPVPFAEKLVNDGTSVEHARKIVFDELAVKSSEPGEIRNQITITRDERDTCRSLVENALLHRYNPNTYKLLDGARQFRGLSLLETGRDWVERQGIKTRGLSRSELAAVILGLETRAGGMMGTTDFPNILANVANKTLRAAYEAAPQTFKPFSRQTTNPDFKTVARTQLGDAPSLEKVNESGEIKRGSMSDAKEQYALVEYAKIVAISRAAIINDDLDAFTRLPELFGRAAADLESDTVWGVITANAAMGDNISLFNASHGNLAGSASAISIAALGAARSALRTQKGLNGRFMNIDSKYILVPTTLETIAEQYVTQTNIIYTQSSDYNPFANKLQVITEPRLDANSTTAWYLAADPAQIDTIEYAYLEGEEGVFLESRVGFDVDGLELKVRLDFAAKAIDWRGFYKNAGE